MVLIQVVMPAGFLPNRDCDRQIGDRRWFNGFERRPTGPSAYLPAGSFMTSLHCPRSCTLIGCSSDRRDFYHQACVSRERAFTNLMPFAYAADEFAGSDAFAALCKVRGAPIFRMQTEKSKKRGVPTEVYGLWWLCVFV